MKRCICGSYAINPCYHGRDKEDLDLCDVCYWRKRAEFYKKCLEETQKKMEKGE